MIFAVTLGCKCAQTHALNPAFLSDTAWLLTKCKFAWPNRFDVRKMGFVTKKALSNTQVFIPVGAPAYLAIKMN